MEAHRAEYEANLLAGNNSHPRYYHVLNADGPYGDQWEYLRGVAEDCDDAELRGVVEEYASSEGPQPRL